MNVSEKIRYRDLKDRRISTITIHNGRFHADDVFCAALCQIINPKIQIIRTRDLNEFKGLCCDVGGGRYDHHPINGEDKEKRKNGVYYAAFGKLWRDIGYDFCHDLFPKENYKDLFLYMDKYFIELIDAKDNGLFGYKGYPQTIVIPDFGIYNKLLNDEDENECFERALNIAKINFEQAINICLRYTAQDIAKKKACEIVKKSIGNLDGGVLLLPQPCIWEQAVSSLGKKCLMVIMPEKNGYVAYGVPNDGPGSMRRCYFPKEWSVGANAEKISKIPQMTFCYNPSGFMAAFHGEGAKEAAIKACKIAIAKQKGESFII